ncbi:NAD(P)H-hydrate dehydratase [Aliiroseovarius sp. 2305UL8-7]|uniref:NAD(P)H-hydrate dehydratase n=1 Tax=Aliiroseovarius conchicola TaxID=3121637 RepID=UPI003529A925
MTELLKAAQMKAIEQAAIDSGEVTGLELMERAGRGVVEAIFEEWPELSKTSHKAVVLCGPGNNGGDGFVVARLLKESGWEVEVFLYGDADKLPPDARVNYERWGEMGVVHDFLMPLQDFPDHLKTMTEGEEGIVLDALFGTGLTRALDSDARRRLSELHSLVPICFLKSVSVDAPSGLCCDSGKWLLDEEGYSAEFWTDLCVSFHSYKLGHLLENCFVKSFRVKSIGLSEVMSHVSLATTQKMFQGLGNVLAESAGPDALKSLLRQEFEAEIEVLPELPPVSLVQRMSEETEKHGDHKYSHGHALILSGPSGKGGAARLAARGALRIGAGLVTVAPTPGALQENAARLDAIMLSPVGDAPTLEATLVDERLNALCLGPGLGQRRARDLVPVALAAKRATVLDADALTTYAENPAELFDMLYENCVLTPHAGEFGRLFPDIAEKLNAPATKGPAYSKVDATREAAARAGCVVLFKGPDTVIAAPEGTCSINSAAYERQAPWLATAGSGDVLAGFITGLLARGFSPMQAAETAAWLHVECALEFGPGLIAEDLPEMLPKVFRKLSA